MTDRWPRVDEKLVIELWNKGLTGLQIARELKTTRSAILGKIARLRRNGVVFERQHTPREKANKEFVPKRSRARPPSLAVIPKVAPVLPVSKPKPAGYMGQSIPFKKITNKTCKYSVSGDIPEDFLFCGDPVYKKSFCEHHYKLCYGFGSINNDVVAA